MMKEYVWELHESYSSGSEELDIRSWDGWGETDEVRLMKRKQAQVAFARVTGLPQAAAELATNNVYNWHEHSTYSSRELSEAVEELAEELTLFLGKDRDQERLASLRAFLELFVDRELKGEEPYLLGYDKEADKIVQRFVVATGIPRRFSVGILHTARIARDTKSPYHQTRLESLERELELCHLLVKEDL